MALIELMKTSTISQSLSDTKCIRQLKLNSAHAFNGTRIQHACWRQWFGTVVCFVVAYCLRTVVKLVHRRTWRIIWVLDNDWWQYGRSWLNGTGQMAFCSLGCVRFCRNYRAEVRWTRGALFWNNIFTKVPNITELSALGRQTARVQCLVGVGWVVVLNIWAKGVVLGWCGWLCFGLSALVCSLMVYTFCMIFFSPLNVSVTRF
jgi:hypothetical protein